jgi:hypothetical protein
MSVLPYYALFEALRAREREGGRELEYHDPNK